MLCVLPFHIMYLSIIVLPQFVHIFLQFWLVDLFLFIFILELFKLRLVFLRVEFSWIIRNIPWFVHIKILVGLIRSEICDKDHHSSMFSLGWPDPCPPPVYVIFNNNGNITHYVIKPKYLHQFGTITSVKAENFEFEFQRRCLNRKTLINSDIKALTPSTRLWLMALMKLCLPL